MTKQRRYATIPVVWIFDNSPDTAERVLRPIKYLVVSVEISSPYRQSSFLGEESIVERKMWFGTISVICIVSLILAVVYLVLTYT